MDGILMKELHGSLNLLSEESMKTLVKYYETGILSSQEQNSLLNELTEQKDTLKALRSLN
tara:strand:+ start:807 stop:986 length:180 start_codon:yes stop_codon:yes gene_type:complete